MDDLARIERMTAAATQIADGVKKGLILSSGYRVGARQLAAMLCPRTKDGLRKAEEIRPWVLKACAAAGLRVVMGHIYCRDIVADVQQLEEYAQCGYDLMFEEADAG